jgi:4-amino-4-deoxy-L-arabinose transferase-like glycosyltransferase
LKKAIFLVLSRLSSKKILILFVFSLYFLLIGYKLMRLGIHGDGVEYANVARNMADGLGSFWKPYHDDFGYLVFHEHPPLVFWIQSIFFRIFGDGPYLESFYGLFMGLLIVGGTGWFWQRVRRDFQLFPIGSWWPMLLLVPLPIFTYILPINRIVNTWTLLAIIATYLAYLSSVKTRHTIYFSILAGGAIYLGFIAKGPVAFFMFAVPLVAWLTLKANFSKALTATLISLITFAVILVATFYFYPDSVKFWKGFWQTQVIASLKSERGSARPHWHLLERWISEMIVPFLIAGVFMLAFKVPFRKIRFDRQALFFLLIALAGSLPFVISTRQHGRYILHSYPLFIIGLAFVTESIAVQIESVLTKKKIMRHSVGVIAAGFLIAAIGSMFYHKDNIARRKPFYHDIYLQKIKLPQRTIVSVCPKDMIHHDWLFADMQRFYRISLTPKMGMDYLIIAKESDCSMPEGYQRINQEPTVKYILFKKISDH